VDRGKEVIRKGQNIIRRYKNFNLMFVDTCIIVKFIQRNPTRCNSVSKF